MTEDEMLTLLQDIHEKLLLHPDAGTTRSETNPDFWDTFYGFECKLAEKLEDE